MADTARRWDPQSRLIWVRERTQVLLFPDGPDQAEARTQLRDALLEVIGILERTRPGAEIQIVIGDRVRPGQRLASVVSRLRHVERHALTRGSAPVVWARRYSLACLLEGLETRQAAAFIEEQLDTLAAYDHEHGTDLLRVLELALDHHNKNTAAHAAFMHRNTFRRQLRKALELIDADIESPEERLALHLALKMRSLRMSGALAGSMQPSSGSRTNGQAAPIV